MSLVVVNQVGGWATIHKRYLVTQDPCFIMEKSILIIDDDRSVRRALRLVLESHGFDCKEADDGLKGLALLDRGLSVDVILSDYHMPGLDGVNFLKALAYRANGQKVPVILLSGNLTKKIEGIAKQTGAFDVITKPYDPERLLTLISRARNQKIS